MSAQPVDARIAHLESSFEQVGNRLNSIDRRLDSLEHRIDAGFNTVDARFNALDARFNWLIGIVVGTWISTILTVLFHRG
jgi:tetrahydromethanopterin S-methyltransferase subunit G